MKRSTNHILTTHTVKLQLVKRERQSVISQQPAKIRQTLVNSY